MDETNVTNLLPSYRKAPHCLLWKVKTYRDWCERVIQDMISNGYKAWLHVELQGDEEFCCVYGERQSWRTK